MKRFDPQHLANELDQHIPADQQELIEVDNAGPLVDAAARLANGQHPQLSAEAMERIQQQMLQAQSNQIRRLFRPTTRILAAVASFLLVFFLVMPIINASVPGETLYPAKRLLENIELNTAKLLNNNEAEVRLRHALRRTDEAVTLIDNGEFDSELIQAALAQVEQAAKVVSPDTIDAVKPQIAQIENQLDYVLAKAQNDSLIGEDVLVTVTNNIAETRYTARILFGEPEIEPTAEPTATITAAPMIVPQQSETETPTPTPTFTFTATATITPSATSTETPTPTDTVSPTSTPEFSPTPEPTIAFVYGSALVNVRSGPGISFPIIAQLSPGDPIEVLALDETGDWVNIQMSDATTGWIADFLVYVGNTPPDLPTISNMGGDSSDEQPDCPGNSCTAPGQTGEHPGGRPDCPGNSCDAPGQTGELPTNPNSNNPTGQQGQGGQPSNRGGGN